jgi:hypothetical protein
MLACQRVCASTNINVPCPLQVLAAVRALHLVLRVVPDALKLAVIVGMGLLLSFVGLQVRKHVLCMILLACFRQANKHAEDLFFAVRCYACAEQL